MAYQSEIEKLERRYDEKPEQWFAALSDAHRKAGDLDEALRIVREGIEVRPNYVSGHIVYGRCLVDQGEDKEARTVFEQVLNLDAENIIALRMLGEICERTGDLEDAQRWLGRLLEVDPMNDDGRELLERIESGGVGVGQGEEAPVDFAGTPELPVDPGDLPDEPRTGDAPDTAPPPEISATAGPMEGEGPTVEMSPPPGALAADTALAEPAGEEEPEALPGPAAEAPFDPAGPEDGPEPDVTESTIEPTAEEPAEPFVLHQESPFAAEDEDDDQRVSLDDVLPDNEGGVFGVTEIDFESDRWKKGGSDSGDALPIGDRQVSLDDLPSPTGDSGLPAGDQTISLDDIEPGESGISDLPEGDREISLDEITPGLAAAMSDAWESPIDHDAGEAETGIQEGEVTQPVPAVDVTSLAADTSDVDETIKDAPEPDPIGAPAAEAVAAGPEVDETDEGQVEPASGESGGGLHVLDSSAEPEILAEPETPVREAGPTVPMSAVDLEKVKREPAASTAETGTNDVEDGSPAEMVTETLAEVYAKQGLVSRAREVYEQLIEANPGDVGLRERLDALREETPDEPDVASAAEQAAGPAELAYLASATGGTSVRTYLSHILAARPGAVVAETEPVSDPVATLPSEPTPLEQAFDEGGDSDADAPEDDSALAAVFEAEEPEAVNPQESGEEGMSFDQFFRTDDAEAEPTSEEKPEDDEDFKNWLQGLRS